MSLAVLGTAAGTYDARESACQLARPGGRWCIARVGVCAWSPSISSPRTTTRVPLFVPDGRIDCQRRKPGPPLQCSWLPHRGAGNWRGRDEVRWRSAMKLSGIFEGQSGRAAQITADSTATRTPLLPVQSWRENAVLSLGCRKSNKLPLTPYVTPRSLSQNGGMAPKRKK